MHIGFLELCTTVTADGNISSQATEVKMAMHIGFVELCMTVTADGDISNQATEVKMTVHIGFVQIYAAGNCCILQTHYSEFQLALIKTLLHAIATHPLTNNTLPAPQKTKLDILPLSPLLFDKGFTISKLISFPS